MFDREAFQIQTKKLLRSFIVPQNEIEGSFSSWLWGIKKLLLHIKSWTGFITR